MENKYEVISFKVEKALGRIRRAVMPVYLLQL